MKEPRTKTATGERCPRRSRDREPFPTVACTRAGLILLCSPDDLRLRTPIVFSAEEHTIRAHCCTEPLTKELELCTAIKEIFGHLRDLTALARFRLDSRTNAWTVGWVVEALRAISPGFKQWSGARCRATRPLYPQIRVAKLSFFLSTTRYDTEIRRWRYCSTRRLMAQTAQV